MVSYNFAPEFAKSVWDGSKPQTIRFNGKRRHVRVGEVVHLFTGMQHPNCVRLMEAECTEALPIEVHEVGLRIWTAGVKAEGAPHEFMVDTKVLDAFAQLDGFKNFDNLQAFFDSRYRLPALDFTLIRWNPAKALYRATSADMKGLVA